MAHRARLAARRRLSGIRLEPAWSATAATAAPAPAPAPLIQRGGEPERKSAASARIRSSPGTMKQAPPTSAPMRPRSRQAQKIASWVDAGPGRRLQAAIASSNSRGSSQLRRSTQSWRRRAMWAGGPPKPMQPIRPHSRAIVSSPGGPVLVCSAAGAVAVWGRLVSGRVGRARSGCRRDRRPGSAGRPGR